jgi:predicted methyltransferase
MGGNIINLVDGRFVFLELREVLDTKDLGNIKEKNKIVLVKIDWNENVDSLNEAIEKLLENNIKFCVLVEITNKNYIYLEEVVEFLKNKNCENIIFSMTNKSEEMIKFSDIKDVLEDILNNTEFKISVSGLPFCFLENNRDHMASIIGKGTKLSRCKNCEFGSLCLGVNKKYIDKYGDDEIIPIVKLKEKIRNARKRINENSLIYVSDDDIFYLLKEFEKEEDFWVVIKKLGYPIAITIQMIDELEKKKVISVENNKIKVEIKNKENNNKIKDYSNLRLESDPDASQLVVEQKDVEKRIDYIVEKCPSGGKIVFLGDDDFISLSMASKNHFDKITVLEFDLKIAEKINEIAQKERYDIEVIVHDLRKQLPEKLLSKFDVFCTDSPYSMPGFTLFVSRGVELLKKDPKKHGFASFSCEMPEIEMVELPSQASINKMKLLIDKKEIGACNVVPSALLKNSIGELRRKLTNYKELSKQERWYLGALARKEFLFHFLTTNQTRNLVKGDFNEELYFTDYALNFYVDDDLKKELKKNPVFDWKKS